MSTLLEIKRKIERPLDMEDEDFVSPEEELDYIHEALKAASAVIYDLYEDYFKTKDYIDLITDEDTYSPPEDIYARKIRQIFYKNTSTGEKYEILPIDEDDIPYVEDEDDYRYSLENSGADGLQIVLHPKSRETSTTNVTIRYIRDINLPTSDSDELDMPEHEDFIVNYVQYKILEKEIENPMLAAKAKDLETSENLMVATLQNSVPDSNNEIKMEMSFYRDSDTDYDYDY